MTISNETFILIWISAVVGAVLSKYLTPKNMIKWTKNDFLDTIITGLVFGLGIMIVVWLALDVLNII